MVPLVESHLERLCVRCHVSCLGRHVRRICREEPACKFENGLLHHLLVQVGHDAECHPARYELLLDESQEFVSGDLPDRRLGAEDVAAERMPLEQQFLELVIDIFGRSVLV